MKEKDNNSILVVDDNHFALNVITALLKDDGYSVIPCESAAEAIKILNQNNIDIDAVVTDIKMPGISGV